VTWLVAFGVAAAFLGGWEAFWRSQGFKPSVNDDPGLWALARSRVYEGGPAAVVIVGSSRMQFAVDREAFVETTGWQEPVQLAILMGPSQPVLRDLATDERFTGTVLCEVNPALFFRRQKGVEPFAAPYIERFRTLGWGDRLEERLIARMQGAFVFRLPALAPQRLWGALQRGVFPTPSHFSVDARRYRFADYELNRNQALQNRRAAAVRRRTPLERLSPAELEAELSEVEVSVQRIRARGGAVVFVQLPSSGHIRADDERRAPRERSWDVFAAGTSALAIHYQDHPELADFTSPDGEHLGRADATAFTRALGKILVREFGRRGAAPGATQGVPSS
jgi:hypothetical protein